MRSDDTNDRMRAGVNRRGALKRLGGGAAALTLGLSGCVSNTEQGTATGTGTDDIGTATFGILVPTSGPSAPLGKSQRRGAELGVEYVNGSDAFDFEIEAVYEDTQTDPATGQQKATKVVEQDGAQFVAGALESSVALAVSDYVSGQNALYTSGAATIELTGSECSERTFRNETNAAQQMAGLADFAAAELGSNWWLHTTDDAYGNSAFTQIERRVEARGLDIDIVGRTMPEKGRQDYGPQISQIANSEAEVVVLPETGGDLIRFMKQAESAGLKEDVEIIGTALFAQVSRAALGGTAVGTYSSTLYNHKLETGDNQQFVEAFMDEHDSPPGSFARVGYELVRTAARGIQAAGTRAPSQVSDALEDRDIETVLGQTPYRGCDHQAVNPVWTGEIVAPESEDAIPGVELLRKVEGEDAIRPCDETGCSF